MFQHNVNAKSRSRLIRSFRGSTHQIWKRKVDQVLNAANEGHALDPLQGRAPPNYTSGKSSRVCTGLKISSIRNLRYGLQKPRWIRRFNTDGFQLISNYPLQWYDTHFEDEQSNFEEQRLINANHRGETSIDSGNQRLKSQEPYFLNFNDDGIPTLQCALGQGEPTKH